MIDHPLSRLQRRPEAMFPHTSITTSRRSIIIATLSLLLVGTPTLAQPAAQSGMMETKAKQAMIVDGETGAILLEKNADVPFPPASLAKLMTMEVVFEAITAGTLARDREFPVSEHAWRTGGAPSGTSTMFAKLKSSIPLDALMRGTIVQAANDAAIVIAEGMAGSEEAFARLMNETASSLGLTTSRFVNPTGLPAEGQTVTVRDLTLLARHIRTAHQDFYGLYSQPDFEWNGIFQRNRNPLLPLDVGATGMGTGFTEASGYSLVGVTERDGRTTFIALGGMASVKERADEAKRLLDWSNTAFRREELFAAGAAVGTAVVYGGVGGDVPLVTRQAVVAYVPVDRPDIVTAIIRYDGPLQAPVSAGDRVGRIEVRIDGTLSVAADLFTASAVEQGTFSARALGAASELAFGWIKAL